MQACLRVGSCEQKIGQGSLPRKPHCSRVKPEMSRISFLINPFTRRCTLTNFKVGGTRNPHEGNNAACLRVGNCEQKIGKPHCSQVKPEMSRISFLINPFTRRCTLTNFQGGGTRNPHEGNNAACLRVGNCEQKIGQGSLPRKPHCSQVKPEMSRISFLINPFARRCALTNFQGGGTRNPHEGNNAACLRVGNCENKLARAACQEESPTVLR